jgi:hypothetical protein
MSYSQVISARKNIAICNFTVVFIASIILQDSSWVRIELRIEKLMFIDRNFVAYILTLSLILLLSRKSPETKAKKRNLETKVS